MRLEDAEVISVCGAGAPTLSAKLPPFFIKRGRLATQCRIETGATLDDELFDCVRKLAQRESKVVVLEFKALTMGDFEVIARDSDVVIFADDEKGIVIAAEVLGVLRVQD
ncbi:MAG TPA: hypothetical protein VMF32_25420 [Xanthobacteraceae bacterium]|nr:hypothetical protein [Xanthobacteraceae bacterium]